jgi:hypothetical protein
MSRELNREQLLELERLVDDVGVAAVLKAVSELAHERSERMRADWESKPLAKPWTAIAGAVGALSKTCAV